MATIDWPAGLPQNLLISGYSQSAADNLLRTPMDAGPAKVRRRFTSGVRQIQGDILVTSSQLSTFKTFYNTMLLYGTLRFNWTDPDDQTTSVEMRFTAPPSWVPAGYGGHFRISMALEILT